MATSDPKISAFLSLSSTIHSFSSSEAPLLNLTLVSHHPSTITIYGDDLVPTLLLIHGALKITDLTTGLEVRQSKRTRCKFEPPTKVHISLNEDLFHEMRPEEPVTLSTSFGRQRKPLPKGHPNFEDGKSVRNGCTLGVDGLEPGHRYLIQLSENSRVHWNTVRWWEYATKEEILRPGADGKRLDGRMVKFRKGPHEPLKLDVSGVNQLEFQCVE